MDWSALLKWKSRSRVVIWVGYSGHLGSIFLWFPGLGFPLSVTCTLRLASLMVAVPNVTSVFPASRGRKSFLSDTLSWEWENSFPRSSQQLSPLHLIGATGSFLSQFLCPSKCHVQFGIGLSCWTYDCGENTGFTLPETHSLIWAGR